MIWSSGVPRAPWYSRKGIVRGPARVTGMVQWRSSRPSAIARVGSPPMPSPL